MEEKGGGPEGSANGAPSNQGGISVPDFLPPAQRVLFLRIQQKQQEEEERARRIAGGGSEKGRDTEGRKDPAASTLNCGIYFELIIFGIDFVFRLGYILSNGISLTHSNIIY